MRQFKLLILTVLTFSFVFSAMALERTGIQSSVSKAKSTMAQRNASSSSARTNSRSNGVKAAASVSARRAVRAVPNIDLNSLRRALNRKKLPAITLKVDQGFDANSEAGKKVRACRTKGKQKYDAYRNKYNSCVEFQGSVSDLEEEFGVGNVTSEKIAEIC